MSGTIDLNQRVIFALDVAHPDEARSWIECLDSEIKCFKIGLQLFLAGGWEMVDYIHKRGNRVMLDLKFFDIPQTVANAVQQLQGRGIEFATVHGNTSIIKAAVEAKGEVKILAVTVLTSFDQGDMEDFAMSKSIADLVIGRTDQAINAGCDGVVASAQEVAAIRQRFGNNFLVVTPGIRSMTESDVTTDDQKRVASPKQAIRDGADHLVIGRPIRDAAEPLQAVHRIMQAVESGLAKRRSE